MGWFFKTKEEKEVLRKQREERNKRDRYVWEQIIKIYSHICFLFNFGTEGDNWCRYNYYKIKDIEPEIKKEVIMKVLENFHMIERNRDEVKEMIDCVINGKVDEHPKKQEVECIRELTEDEIKAYKKYKEYVDTHGYNEYSKILLPFDGEEVFKKYRDNKFYLIEHKDIGFMLWHGDIYIYFSNNYITYENDDYDNYSEGGGSRGIEPYDRGGLLMNR